MFIKIDLELDVPIYQQLRNSIIEGIASKELAPGDPLPSVRAMAADLGVNMHTVNKAYQMLKQEGFILIHRQKGVVIQPDQMPPADETYLEGLAGQLRPLVSEAICRGLGQKQFLQMCEKLYNDIQK
ncbi:GntR family transcriptional regulator [Weizmannia acidilactici]|uniref:GntR family transcriptional regulator n=1 Tax=Weizmannia acidilactici TaxID=2607726 RepID=A0A5J4JJ55_9BACI|nr:GntR family transcriptional regulator [Heyndrickxia coagulans]GER67988.1 GntR family transcriptional regulator [Weizmannia acidilactici]GER71801.1 GntR family transcriptional regulator [Weizmannia acidilactici]GER75183.1 GntR family transcriptional regulator [Weizmannia acidilactici]